MNNTVIKNIAFVASGALFGALGGYYGAKKVLSEKFEKDLADCKTSQENYIKNLKLELGIAQSMIDIYEQAGLKFETAIEIAKKNAQAQEAKEKRLNSEAAKAGDIKTAYSKLVNYATGSKSQDAEEQEEKENDDEAPYLISVDQFSEEHDDFKKVSCVYYTEDNIICETAHSEKISADSVGRENLDMLLSSDIDILYVRNETLGVDYEIDKYEGSYAYEVLGEESLNE